jgi:hypothetical protein
LTLCHSPVSIRLVFSKELSVKDMQFNLMAQAEVSRRLEDLPGMLATIEGLLNVDKNTPGFEEKCAVKAGVWIEYIQLLMTIKSGAEIDIEHLTEKSEEGDKTPLC